MHIAELIHDLVQLPISKKQPSAAFFMRCSIEIK